VKKGTAITVSIEEVQEVATEVALAELLGVVDVLDTNNEE
jgi:hypothetical protein